MTSESSGLALARSLSLLTPPIFSHPLWSELIHNPDQTAQLSDRLPDLAESILQKRDFSSACQLFLAAAVLEGRCGNYSAALNHIRYSEKIAGAQRLPCELIWSDWGMAAINAQQGDEQQARVSLSQLKERLIESGDWVVGTVVEFVDLTLPKLADELTGASFPLEWLFRWGEPPELILSEQARRSENKLETRRNGFLHRLSRQTHRLRNLIPSWFIRLRLGKNLANHDFRFELHNQVSDPCPGQEPGNSEPVFRIVNGHLITDGDYGRHTFDELGRTSLLSVSSGLIAPSDVPEVSVIAYFLGKFRVFISETPIEAWSSRKGMAVFKYLVAHRSSPVQREILMDTFWPDAEPDSARNRLNVALHSLRKTFQTYTSKPIILFTRDAYLLNPEIEFWIDFEEFERHLHNGQKFEAAAQAEAVIYENESAISLYQGDFLEEDRYEEWTIMVRERLRLAYMNCLSQISQVYFLQGHYLATAALCQRILAYDDCSENAYRLLMRCYARQGQPYLALRLYLTCQVKLRTELDISPSLETQALYNLIRRHESV